MTFQELKTNTLLSGCEEVLKNHREKNFENDGSIESDEELRQRLILTSNIEGHPYKFEIHIGDTGFPEGRAILSLWGVADNSALNFGPKDGFNEYADFDKFRSYHIENMIDRAFGLAKEKVKRFHAPRRRSF